jgi:hypothetical protein
LREKTKVRVLLIFSPPPQSSPINGEEVFPENFSAPNSSLPLRERIKVRGAVKFFSSLSTLLERARVRVL